MAFMPGMGFPQGPLGQPMPMPTPMPGAGPLAGPQPPQAGPKWLQNFGNRLQGAVANPMFQMGMGLLSAGQDSRINAPQAAMQGLLSAHQVQQQQAAEQRTQALFEQQQAEQERRRQVGERVKGLLETAEDIDVPASFRESVGLLAEINPESALQMLSRATGTVGSDKTPMGVLEYEYYKSLPSDDERREYLNVKRAMQFQTVEQAPTRIDPVTGQPIPLSGATLPDATAREIDAAAGMQAAKTAAGQGGVNVTPGQEAVDRKFADEYVAWQAAGGFADVEKQLEQLRSVRERLLSSDSLTGPIVGNVPFRSVLAPASRDAQDTVEDVVQRSLRTVLGAQFTEKEGERLIARAYNPRLDEKTNAERIDRLIRQLEEAAKAKDSAARYFAEHGTLAGWQGRLFTLEDFERAIDGDTGEGGVTGDPEIDALIEQYTRN